MCRLTAVSRRCCGSGGCHRVVRSRSPHPRGSPSCRRARRAGDARPGSRGHRGAGRGSGYRDRACGRSCRTPAVEPQVVGHRREKLVDLGPLLPHQAPVEVTPVVGGPRRTTPVDLLVQVLHDALLRVVQPAVRGRGQQPPRATHLDLDVGAELPRVVAVPAEQGTVEVGGRVRPGSRSRRPAPRASSTPRGCRRARRPGRPTPGTARRAGRAGPSPGERATHRAPP